MHVGQYSAIFKLTHVNVIYDILISLIFCYRNFYWNGCLFPQENYIEDFGSFVAKKCNVIYPKRGGSFPTQKKQSIEGTDFLSLNHLLRNKLAKLIRCANRVRFGSQCPIPCQPPCFPTCQPPCPPPCRLGHQSARWS